MSAFRFFFRKLCFFLFAATALASCTLEKEADIPVGATNERRPIFLSNRLIVVTSSEVSALTHLQDLGQLSILHYGWVWGLNSMPSLENNDEHATKDGPLQIDSFELSIRPLMQGKTYYFRPFVETASGVSYGKETSIFTGLPELNECTVLADSACMFRLKVSLASPSDLQEYGIVYLSGTGNPDLDNRTGIVLGTSGAANGYFTVDVEGLTPASTYSFRGYAINGQGKGYSPVLTVNTVAAPVLSANFAFDTDADIFQGAVVNWQNSSIGANALSWDFGDGNQAGGSNPTHTFEQKGSWTVRLVARNSGCTAQKDTLIKVADNPFRDYLVQLPGGMFTMGCTSEQGASCDNDELPPHNVIVSAFSIGKTEVTQAQWEAVMHENPSIHYLCGGNCPVERVSWDRITNAFIPALRRKTGKWYSLPTEAEWEFAARGGLDEAHYTVYAGSDVVDSVAWYNGNISTLQPVAGKKPNGFGLYDMSGNALEYCSDWYNATYYLSLPPLVQDPVGPPGGDWRVVRSGSYFNIAEACRATSRDLWFTDSGADNLGFRLAYRP